MRKYLTKIIFITPLFILFKIGFCHRVYIDGIYWESERVISIRTLSNREVNHFISFLNRKDSTHMVKTFTSTGDSFGVYFIDQSHGIVGGGPAQMIRQTENKMIFRIYELRNDKNALNEVKWVLKKSLNQEPNELYYTPPPCSGPATNVDYQDVNLVFDFLFFNDLNYEIREEDVLKEIHFIHNKDTFPNLYFIQELAKEMDGFVNLRVVQETFRHNKYSGGKFFFKMPIMDDKIILKELHEVRNSKFWPLKEELEKALRYKYFEIKTPHTIKLSSMIIVVDLYLRD